MAKKKKQNPIYIPNSYEQSLGGFIDSDGKSFKERKKEWEIQKKLSLKKK